MLTDLDCANLLQSQYDGVGDFDYQDRIGEVSFAVIKYKDFTAVLFEGSHNIPDWFSNFRFVPIYITGYGLVEQGFWESMTEVKDAINKYITPDSPVIICGHSRGAAHANIYAMQLVASGMSRGLIRCVKFGEPHSVSHDTAKSLGGFSAVSYQNYHSPFDQDLVCTVPLWPLVPSEARTIVDVSPIPDDPWLLLSRHHLFLYAKAKEVICAYSFWLPTS